MPQVYTKQNFEKLPKNEIVLPAMLFDLIMTKFEKNYNPHMIQGVLLTGSPLNLLSVGR